MFRMILGLVYSSDSPTHITDLGIVDEFQVLHPYNLLRCARLALFGRVCSKPCSILESMCQLNQFYPGSWASSVVKLDVASPGDEGTIWNISDFRDFILRDTIFFPNGFGRLGIPHPPLSSIMPMLSPISLLLLHFPPSQPQKLLVVLVASHLSLCRK